MSPSLRLSAESCRAQEEQEEEEEEASSIPGSSQYICASIRMSGKSLPFRARQAAGLLGEDYLPSYPRSSPSGISWDLADACEPKPPAQQRPQLTVMLETGT